MESTTALNTFQLVHKNDIYSPPLITTREYGRFILDEYKYVIGNSEVFKKEAKNGTPLRVYHPGSKLGVYFDKHKFTSQNLSSWFFNREFSAYDRLFQYGLATYDDYNYVTIDGVKEKRLRTYTPEQIELYIRNNIDPDFEISKFLTAPKQVKIVDADLKYIIHPIVEKRKTLF